MEVIIDDDGSASSHGPNDWLAIDWRRVEQHVRTVQMRIAKATQEGDWRRVKALQRSLTRSFAARALAVRRVTENQGKRTAGVDRELWGTPTCKWEAVSAIKQQRGYRPQPLRRVFIPKANGKERPLGIPTMKDRAMQALHLLGLEPVVESQSDPNSYGFRRNRSTADAMSQLFVCLSQKASAPWVLEADIEGCFDHINHEWLVSQARMDRVILNKWLKAGVVYKGHPKKSPRWVAEKYWPTVEGRTEFATGTRAEDGQTQWVRLYRLADTEIVRHRKVMGGYNPFDPRWEAYGEDLSAKRLLKSRAYLKQWATLYGEQQGKCALCAGAITEETGWHDHHLIQRMAGGSDSLKNRVLLHPVCHVQLHAKGLTVAKPASG